jgi:hypothetical protein
MFLAVSLGRGCLQVSLNTTDGAIESPGDLLHCETLVCQLPGLSSPITVIL